MARRPRPPGTARKLIASMAVMGCVLGLLATLGTWSAFTSVTSNSANSTAAGSVTLTDNDAGGVLFNYSAMKPADTTATCIQVTYTGSLPSLVRVYGTTAGTGLDPYLGLTVTRGTISSGSFNSCTNFSADATNWIGSGAGVVYSGTLQGFADDWTAGTVDAKPAVPEAWTTNEVHAYKFQVTVQDNNAAQSLSVSQTFTWEARNTTLYSQVVLSDNPAGYWKLDEAAGTTATDATDGANGTYSGSPQLNQSSGVRDAGTAVTFADLGADRVNVGDVHDYAGTASFSVEFWVKPTAAIGYWRRVISKESTGGWYIMLGAVGTGSSNKIMFERGWAIWDLAESTSSLTAGTWYHVVCTYDGSNMRLYVNGSLNSTTATTRTIENNTNALTFGSPVNGATTFGGGLDEVAIYAFPLTAQQVSEHYNTGRP